MSLLVVMVCVSASLVITLAFVRTQTSTARIRQNASRCDLALQAAHTGAAVALEAMHSPTWGGVDVPLSRDVLSDAEGTSSFQVTYVPIEQTNPPVVPKDAPLYVVVRSTGKWVSAANAAEQVSKKVEVVARLLPRVPGRTIGPGDSANASDVAPNPGAYDQIQSYAAAVKVLTQPFQVEPGNRVDGNLWLYDNPKIYGDEQWSATVRDTMLDAIGSQFGTTTGGPAILHPHPLRGQLTFRTTPSAAIQSDLARLGVTWAQNGTVPSWPTVSYVPHQSYKVFQGGFTYQAVLLGSLQFNVTHKPTAANPLGIFYTGSDISLLNGTNIHGTLVCPQTVSIFGDWIHVASVNWLDTAGAAITWEGDKWPRPPAIIAKNMTIDGATKATITGAVAVQQTFQAGGGNFEYTAVNDVLITGTATAQPIEQPRSLVQLQGAPNLSSIDASGNYSVWLENGATGGWHEIIGVDNTLKKLTIIGEVRHESPVNFRIRRTRLRFTDVQGPILAEKVLLKRSAAWNTPTAANWDTHYAAWTAINVDRAANSLPPMTFTDYLADPANWSGWSNPHATYGLPLEPTVHLSNPSGVKYLWSAPLFAPYNGTGPDAQYAGYRWKVISWREVL